MAGRSGQDTIVGGAGKVRLGKSAGTICGANVRTFVGDASAGRVSQGCHGLWKPAAVRGAGGAAADSAGRHQRDWAGSGIARGTLISLAASALRLLHPRDSRKRAGASAVLLRGAY